MFKLKKLNNEVVKPVKLVEVKEDTRPILGEALFPEIYCNTYICSKKKSGKSSVISKIVKKCSNKHTSVIAFVSTLHKDNVWKAIRDYCDKKGIPFVGYTSLLDRGSDRLEELVNELENEVGNEQDDADNEEEKEEKKKVLLFDSDNDEEAEEKKVRKSKYRSPDYLIICDDLSTEIKRKSLVGLLKKNRHFLSKVIISSQWLNDMDPQSIKQLDYIILFKGQSTKKLEEIHQKIDLSVSFETFIQVYKFATKQIYNFLYIDIASQQFRKNFNYMIDLPDDDD